MRFVLETKQSFSHGSAGIPCMRLIALFFVSNAFSEVKVNNQSYVNIFYSFGKKREFTFMWPLESEINFSTNDIDS